MTSHALLTGQTDLRKTPRILFRRSAVLRLNAEKTVAAKTSDISVEGICLLADISLNAGALCTVEFNASYTEEPIILRLQAQVAYCVLAGQDGFRLGFQFHDLDQQAKNYIQKILSMQKY